MFEALIDEVIGDKLTDLFMVGDNLMEGRGEFRRELIQRFCYDRQIKLFKLADNIFLFYVCRDNTFCTPFYEFFQCGI